MRLIDANNLQDEIERLMQNYENPAHRVIVTDIMATIEIQPTCSEFTWIPCDERLPEEVGNYIIHTIDGNGEDYVGMWYYCRGEHLGSKQHYIDDRNGYWANAWSGEPIGEEISKRCVAWMHLPKPYKED